jgi:biotin carboxyl carrier protein
VVAGVLVREGDVVQAGHVLTVLESMKMENELRAPGDGVVREVLVAAEDEVDLNQVLIVFEVT